MGHLWGGLPLTLRVKTHIKMHVDVFKKSSYIILIFQKWPNRIDRLKIRRDRFILTQFLHGLLRATFSYQWRSRLDRSQIFGIWNSSTCKGRLF